MMKNLKLLNNKQIYRNSTHSEMEVAFKLINFASRGDVKSLQEELDKGTNINSCDYDKRTPYHIAASVGQYEVVKWFLQNKIQIPQDRFGATPYTDSIRNKHFEIQELFQTYQAEESEISQSLTLEKDDQKNVVFQLIVRENIFNYTLVAKTVDYYFNELKLDNYYYKVFSATQISKHISMLITAQNIAAINKDPENLDINYSTGKQHIYICSEENRKNVEKKIEQQMKKISINQSLSLMQIQSQAPAQIQGKQRLIITVLSSEDYENPHMIETNNLYIAASQSFIQKRDRKVLARYQKLIEKAAVQPNIQAQVFQDTTGEHIFMFGVNEGRALDTQEGHSSSQLELSKLFQDNNINIKKKFIETFSNGVIIYTYYADKICNQSEIDDILKISNSIFNIPDNIFVQKMLNKEIDGYQATYLETCLIFAFYFMNNKMEDYESLMKYLENDSQSQNRLINLKQNQVRENVNFDRLYEIITKYQSISLCLYQNFVDRLEGRPETYQDIIQLLKPIDETSEKEIFQTINNFNKAIVKTNFFNPKKSASSFRLDPKIFLQNLQLPEIPFGVYLIVGRYFTGFHIRFRDISRGGIRIIKSNSQNYQQNRIIQFNENYGLAYTQKKKNKDIPESGSKGTILLANGKNHMAKQSFMQYVDAMSDIMLNVPGVIDLDGKPELLFLGPDENSADLMDPACLFMKKKNYKMWKSFTTGKSPSLGGIPHDVYGMTTTSVRQYVKGIQRKLGLKQEECYKFMTGGPDGDLGSNEILMGKEKIVGIVDGSGVLFDPLGIDREQLEQLAKQRRMISSFNGKLSENGYMVLITDNNKTLPNGQIVESGLNFRNNFHLNEDVCGDFFVPCGGRPESVNLTNVHKMFKRDGTPRFKYIVEGANLFFSEGARKKLESSGVILFKDSSTNKGGVTSSSYEVQAALALLDQEFMKLMTIQNDEIPQFYQKYVKEIVEQVQNKADQEFEYIWSEHQKTGLDNCVISDTLSSNMNNLADIIQTTDLFDKKNIQRNVMAEVIPKSLQELVGLDELLNRIPRNYQQSLFCKHIGAKYYYTNGSNSNIYQFYTFMKRYDY